MTLQDAALWPTTISTCIHQHNNVLFGVHRHDATALSMPRHVAEQGKHVLEVKKPVLVYVLIDVIVREALCNEQLSQCVGVSLVVFALLRIGLMADELLTA